MESADQLWAPHVGTQDLSDFGPEALGSFKLGKNVRSTRIGSLHLGVDQIPGPTFELELFDGVDWKQDENLELQVMRELGRDLQLKHPNLAHVRAVGIDDGIPFLARKFVLGQSLSEAQARGVVNQESLWAWVLQGVARALDCAIGKKSSAYLALTEEDIWIGYDSSIQLQLSRPRLVGILENNQVIHPKDAFTWFSDGPGQLYPQLLAELEYAESYERLVDNLQHWLPPSFPRATLGQRLRFAFGEELVDERSEHGLAPLH